MGHWHSPTCKRFLFYLSSVCEARFQARTSCFRLLICFMQPFSFSHFYAQMLPVTIVKRFLNRQLPKAPLPRAIDEDLTSNSNSWPSPRSRVTPNTSTAACQTSPTQTILDTKPRARIREDLFDADHALPPPKFRPKSKLPKFHYGGLQAPALHSFASSSQPNNTVKLPPQIKLLQASAKSLPSPTKFYPPIKTLQCTEDKETMDSEPSASSGKSFMGLGFLANSIVKYAIQHSLTNISTVNGGSWLPPCLRSLEEEKELSTNKNQDDNTHQSSPMDCSEARSTDSFSAAKPNSFRLLEVTTRIPCERSEATPIPIAVLAAWEELRLSEDSHPAESLTLGCFLIATIAFRDLLGTKPQPLSSQGHILRGISWRTKTSVSGQPWGVWCLEVSTRPSEQIPRNCGFRYQTKSTILSQQWAPNFLFPSWTDSIPFSSPCSYHHGLTLIRYYAQCSWLRPPVSPY